MDKMCRNENKDIRKEYRMTSVNCPLPLPVPHQAHSSQQPTNRNDDHLTSVKHPRPLPVNPLALASSSGQQTIRNENGPTSGKHCWPVNPLVSSSRQTTNKPLYTYKRLATIKHDTLKTSNFSRINTIAVVHQMLKTITLTNNRRYTIICQLVDETTGGDTFTCHFFTPGDTILKQVEVGDVVRLHQVKVELSPRDGDVDGRVFQEADIVLFKRNSEDETPFALPTVAPVTDLDKLRVKELKTWYTGWNELQLGGVVLLSDICAEGRYQVLVKVVSEPRSVPIVAEDRRMKVVLQVTDGSVVHLLSPAFPLPDEDSAASSPHVVTEINVCKRQEAFLYLKPGDFVMLREVEAIKLGSFFQLVINTHVYYQILDTNTTRVLDIERQLQQLEHLKDVPESSNLYQAPAQPEPESHNNDKGPSSVRENSQPDCADGGKTPHNLCANETNKNKKKTLSSVKRKLLKAAVAKVMKLVEEDFDLTDSDHGTPEEAVVRNRGSKRKGEIEKDSSKEKHISPEELKEKFEETSIECEMICQNNFLKKQERKNNITRLDEESTVESVDSMDVACGQPTCQAGPSQLPDCSNRGMGMGWKSEIAEALRSDPVCGGTRPYEVRRLKLTLKKVIPEPKEEPLDLVSGYCYAGCHQLFLYTRLHWQAHTPLCPSCLRLQVELMFMVELEVADLHGRLSTVLVCREHAETFFDCSVKRFVLDPAVRLRVSQLLSKYTISRTLRTLYPPQLDVSVVILRNHYVIIDSKLNQCLFLPKQN